MRYGIFSDVHANYSALDTVLKDMSNKAVDRLICCGDIVGYGSDPMRCIKVLMENDVWCVQGNHDLAVTGGIGYAGWVGNAIITWKKAQDIIGIEELEWLASHPVKAKVTPDILVVHGSPRNSYSEYIFLADMAKKCAPFMMGAKICLFGHTHIPSAFERVGQDWFSYAPKLDRWEPRPKRITLKEGGIYLINPGSIGQPRDQDPRASYCILDTDEMKVVYYRVSYDIKVTQSRMSDRNYPPSLIYRLQYGT